MPLDTHFDQDGFTTSQTCNATDALLSDLRNWTARNPPVILLSDDARRKAVSGIPILFSFQRVMQVALTVELSKEEDGIKPRQAAQIAAAFSDTGSVDRKPGHLFKSGATLLVARVGSTEGKVLNLPPQASWMQLVAAAGGPRCFCLLVDPIYRRVCERLGIAG